MLRPWKQPGQPDRCPGGQGASQLGPGSSPSWHPSAPLRHFWRTCGGALGGRHVAFRPSNVVQAMQKSRSEALEPARTARRASRRPGNSPTGCPSALLRHFWNTFGRAQEGRHVAFKPSNDIQVMQKRSSEALEPARTARQASRRPGSSPSAPWQPNKWALEGTIKSPSSEAPHEHIVQIYCILLNIVIY